MYVVYVYVRLMTYVIAELIKVSSS